MDQSRFNLDMIAAALAAPPAPGSSDFDLNPEVRRALPSGRVLRAASVLVPLIERGGQLNVVLTRRAVKLKHHPGQVAFPGGRQDPEDCDALATALREAEEEIGLKPAGVEVLGRLAPHETVTNFTVTPFVARVAAAFQPVPHDAEVDEVFEVPLSFVLDPSNLQTHRRRYQGGWRKYYAIPYGPHYIWGATARILKALSDRTLGRTWEL